MKLNIKFEFFLNNNFHFHFIVRNLVTRKPRKQQNDLHPIKGRPHPFKGLAQNRPLLRALRMEVSPYRLCLLSGFLSRGAALATICSASCAHFELVIPSRFCSTNSPRLGKEFQELLDPIRSCKCGAKRRRDVLCVCMVVYVCVCVCVSVCAFRRVSDRC